ncbi:MAG: hypothetical protein LUC44_02340, partial [Prevotellaceae bacterium]|nr:hypothetical protein [Prevotellaceae bacterium]
RKGKILSKEMLPAGMLTMPDNGFAGWYTEEGTSLADLNVVDHDMEFHEKIIAKSIISWFWGRRTLMSVLPLLVVFTLLMLLLFIKTIIIPIKEAWQ